MSFNIKDKTPSVLFFFFTGLLLTLGILTLPIITANHIMGAFIISALTFVLSIGFLCTSTLSAIEIDKHLENSAKILRGPAQFTFDLYLLAVLVFSLHNMITLLFIIVNQQNFSNINSLVKFDSSFRGVIIMLFATTSLFYISFYLVGSYDRNYQHIQPVEKTGATNPHQPRLQNPYPGTKGSHTPIS